MDSTTDCLPDPTPRMTFRQKLLASQSILDSSGGMEQTDVSEADNSGSCNGTESANDSFSSATLNISPEGVVGDATAAGAVQSHTIRTFLVVFEIL